MLFGNVDSLHFSQRVWRKSITRIWRLWHNDAHELTPSLRVSRVNRHRQKRFIVLHIIAQLWIYIRIDSEIKSNLVSLIAIQNILFILMKCNTVVYYLIFLHKAKHSHLCTFEDLHRARWDVFVYWWNWFHAVVGRHCLTEEQNIQINMQSINKVFNVWEKSEQMHKNNGW